jgi:type II secretory pathway component PulF
MTTKSKEKETIETPEVQWEYVAKDEIEKTILSFMGTLDKGSFSAKDKVLFYKELVYMLKGWLSILQAVEVIRKETTNNAIRNICWTLMHYLNEGKSFSYSLGRLTEYFDEWDSAIVKTWESTGNLDVVLHELADEYEYINQIRNKYISALIYPAFLIVGSIAAVLFLFSSVLPGILDMFSDQMDKLPLVTRVLKSISDFCVEYWKTILIVLWVGTIVAWIYSTTEQGKKKFSWMMLNAPLIWGMTRTYYLIKWAKYMKLMIGSWLDYVQTFRLLREILGIPAYQDMIEQVMAWLQIWKTIYASISTQTDLIYPSVATMIKVWEETACLEDSMQNVINMYQDELDNQINAFSKMLEPIILIFMWVVVALVASWIFWVVFTVMENVGV